MPGKTTKVSTRRNRRQPIDLGIFGNLPATGTASLCRVRTSLRRLRLPERVAIPHSTKMPWGGIDLWFDYNKFKEVTELCQEKEKQHE